MTEIKINAPESVPVMHKKKRHVYPFMRLKLNESFDVGRYTSEAMTGISGYVYYFNKIGFGKHFVQRKVEAEKDYTITIHIRNSYPDTEQVHVKKGDLILRIYRDK